MSIDWTTFLLEVVNFLVLVWILKRFLYQPVLNAIEARRRGIQAETGRIESARQEAEALLTEAQEHLQQWEQERQAKRDALVLALEREREAGLAELEARLADERRRAEALQEEREREATHALERRALTQGARFTARLLERLASPELEARLTELVIHEMEHLSDARRDELRATFGGGDIDAFRVSSTFPLAPALASRLTRAIQQALGAGLPVQIATDPELILGIRVNVGYWVLGANVRDELRFFAEVERDQA